MDRIHELEAFVGVAETGSFTRAADRLDQPKTTVTRLVNDLEQRLQVQLLRRSSRALLLTAAGEEYHRRALRLLAAFAELEDEARATAAQPAGRVRLELTAALASMVVVPALPEFLARYPSVQVELEVGVRSHSLVADHIDCALRLGTPDEQVLVVRRIGEYRTVTCAAPAYLASRGLPRSVADLAAGHELVGLLGPGMRRASHFRFLDGTGEIERPPTARFAFNDANAYLAAGVAGLGILQAPAYALGRALEDGSLLPVLEAHAVARTTPAYVAWTPNRFLGAKVRVLIDWLVEVCGRSPWLKREVPVRNPQQ